METVSYFYPMIKNNCMKTNKVLLPIVGGSALLSACCFFQPLEETPSQEQAQVKSVDFSYMNTSVKPEENFFEYANGQWIKDNPIPASESRYGSFNEVSDRNNEVIKAMLTEAAQSNAEKGSAQQLVGDYYYAILDSNSREAKGHAPLQPIFDLIEGSKKKDFGSLLGKLHLNGFGSVFNLYVDQDLIDNSKYVVNLSQGRQGLPDKDYYFKTDEKSKEIRREYQEHLAAMFGLVGENDAQAKAQRVMDLETALAAASMNRLERRNIQAQYNPYALEGLKSMNSQFSWNQYLGHLELNEIDSLIIGQPNYFEAFDSLLKVTPWSHWQDYLDWVVLNRTASVLSPELEQQNFAFYSAYMRGAKAMKPSWKRAINAMNWTMGEPLGKAFVESNFSAESKARVQEMVELMAEALRERIAQLDWMSDSTKDQAYLKMNSFVKKLGYPDEWNDYSSVDISKDSYLNNWMAISRYHVEDNLSKLGQPIDKKEWGMPAHIVNAYYNPVMNEIVFPAGIMQPPFFVPEAEDAVNYARMGAVIGHEMIHGFDDQGAQFDHEGKFRNWWTDGDKARFEERTNQLAEQYNSYQVLDGVHVNGELTLGENIADFGGLTIAYYAYQKSLEGKEREEINGFTPEQRFFIAFGQIWKGTATEAYLRQQVQTDPHSPVKFRVNGTLSNMPEFFQAFDVPEGSPMRNDEPIVIW